jgi:plastocyanin
VRTLAVAAVVACALAVVGVASADGPVWSGSVGPGFTITLRDASGSVITSAPTGPVTVQVDDNSEEHNFHLYGPGVDVATTVDGIGQSTFQVTLADGVYRFICDPHATRMRGQFTAGAGDGATGGASGGGTGSGGGGGGTGGGTTTTPPSAPVGATLVLTSGPGFTISLKTKAGKRVTRLKPGRYTVSVRDRSGIHNAHLLGAGVDKKTSVPGTGTQTWKVVLKKGKLVFQCDPHKTTMRGVVTVS